MRSVEVPEFHVNIYIANAVLGLALSYLIYLLKGMHKRLDEGFKNVLKELQLVDERIDILDRAVSNVADKSFNSKLIAQDLRSAPTFKKIEELMRTHKHPIKNGAL